MSDVILSLEKATKLYSGVPAIEDVDFELRRGEIHALVGENGAGKSTLTKVMAGVVTLTTGKMKIDGAEAAPGTPLEARQIGVAMVFQENSLVPTMTVAQNCSSDKSVSITVCAASTSRRSSFFSHLTSTFRLRQLSAGSVQPKSKWSRLRARFCTTPR